MLSLAQAPKGIEMKVEEIRDSVELHKKLKKLGITKGKILKVLGEEPHPWFSSGMYKVKVKGKTEVVDHQLAKRVEIRLDGTREYLEDLCAGDSGRVAKVQGNPQEKKLLRELGIEKGAFVEVISHIPNDLLVFELNGQEKRITSCRAARIWASLDGEEIQLDNFPAGKAAVINRLSGSPAERKELIATGFVEGSLVELKEHADNPLDGGFYKNASLVEVEGTAVRLNPIDAEQIWVEAIRN